ncbi:MAG TPA: phosphotransferase family protein [Sporolactobacillaceae bacterium]|nr:phosphotransferase family protein [Sporolactobacillaceae bacterium]
MATSNTVQEKIAGYLQTKLPRARNLALSDFVHSAGGWSHEIYVFYATWNEDGRAMRQGFCLRKDPGSGLLRELSNLRDQFRVIKALEPTPAPTPKAYWYEEDPSLLGGPFFVMERVEGEAPNPWSRAGKQFYADAAKRGKLPRSFVEALASLHNLDWRDVGLDFIGVPGDGKDFALREIAKWESLVDQSIRKPEPVLTELLLWLKANAPETRRLAFVHGAYRTGNLIIKDDEIAAIIDWELQVIGDPMYDVAYVLSNLNSEGSPLLSCVVERELFLDYYQRLTGLTIDLEVCRYYEILYMMRSTAFWLSASGLFAEGRNKDLRLARTTYSVPVVLDMAAKALGF